MAATIQIHEMSAADTGDDKTSGTIRFKVGNNATADSTDPLTIPSSGTNYSYSKKLRPYMEAAPDVSVSNIRWYSDGTSGFGTGIALSAKNLGTTWGANYITAMSGGTNFFTYTSASPLDGDGTDTGPFLPADDDTYIGDLIEFQMSVASTASNGALTAETITLSWDEV